MSCSHLNPAGYAFCGTCGDEVAHVRCRCGFVASPSDVFCGQCGLKLSSAVLKGEQVTADGDRRIDLAKLAQQAAQEKLFLESVHKVRVTQDDIRKLLSTRRKKFK